MWVKQLSKVYQNVTKEEIWQAYVNVNEWPKWDSELSYCELHGVFEAGNSFILQP